jgi:hypothetical protein
MIHYEKLERKIFDVIFGFSERLDEMETRSEENCRLLAARIVALVRAELQPPEGRQRAPDAHR